MKAKLIFYITIILLVCNMCSIAQNDDENANILKSIDDMFKSNPNGSVASGSEESMIITSI